MMGTCKARYILGQRLAGEAVTRAVSLGDIPRAKTLICVDCGDNATEYDHRDYNKPLDIVPTCRSCNGQRGAGKRLSNIPNKYKKRLELIDEMLRVREEKRIEREALIFLSNKNERIANSEPSVFECVIELCRVINIKPEEWIQKQLEIARLK